MKVGDLVRLRVGDSYGIITARYTTLKRDSEWQYFVLWNPPRRYKNRRSGGRIWHKNELEVISEVGS
mgnify:CR=1 FL=1